MNTSRSHHCTQSRVRSQVAKQRLKSVLTFLDAGDLSIRQAVSIPASSVVYLTTVNTEATRYVPERYYYLDPFDIEVIIRHCMVQVGNENTTRTNSVPNIIPITKLI